MVRKYQRKTQTGADGEDTLKDALKAIENGTPLIRASKDFGIPARTLRRHRDKRVKQPGTVKLGRYENVLPDELELELKKHIEMERMMYGLTIKDIRKLAFDLAEKMDIQHPFNKDSKMAGIDWVQSFMKRLDLTLRQPQGTSINHAAGFNKGGVDKFFSLYKGLLEKHKFSPARIWNVDETGLSTVQNPQKVVTSKGIRSVGKITSGERVTLVTMLCACNAAGAFLTPMYFFPRQRMSDSLMAGAPPQPIGFAKKNGWVDQELFVKWPDHFVKFADPSPDNPHIIILDGHHSHKSLVAVDFCRENGIHLLTLPPHCTHKMQALHRTYFKSLKSAFNQVADSYMVANPGRRITIYDIAKLSGNAFLKTALPDKGINGFKVCGIHPYNPSVFDDGDFTAALACREETPAQNEHSSSTENSPLLLNTNEHETASNDLAETSSPGQVNAESGIVHEMSSETMPRSDTDAEVIEHRDIGDSSVEIHGLSDVSNSTS